MSRLRTPTQDQFQKVIDILSKAPKKGKVDMMESNINHCGTPMCHGGWYVILSNKDANRIDYMTGKKLIASDLGFDDYDELITWASKNHKVWGNHFGSMMFFDGRAFGRKTDEFTMQTIINHWKKVKQRAALIEAKQS